ncbi:glycine-rich domain-containing protein [Serratia fonticola]|uniref:glycine-rich domain-containing protein n=1 Tax=Serratia fonticola TaxID=47917 RepID=UPI003F60B9A9
MAKNEFLPFGTAANANVLSNEDYSALPARTSGFLSGVAKSEELNSAWRQASVITSVLAQFIADKTGKDVLDNGDLATLLTNLNSAMLIAGTGRLINTQYFQASGTYTPTPGTKKIRITMTGGGGGGGGCQATNNAQTFSGAGGGAGGTIITMFQLIGATSYPVVVGAGGAGGNGAANGSDGGSTIFATFTAVGGGGAGRTSANNTAGGSGGVPMTGDIRIVGGYGNDGQSSTFFLTGNGGTSYFGGGGRSGTGVGTSGGGVSGSSPGSGGGGAYDPVYSGQASRGGSGAAGIVIIEEFS